MKPRTILIALGACSFVACSSDRPTAVVPKELPEHELGMLDYTVPAGVSRQTLAERFEPGPAPYEVVECSNTYRASTEAPVPSVPSLWLRYDGTQTLVASPLKDVEWAEIECINPTVSRPATGEAWSAFVYTRTLLDGIEWLQPEPRPLGDFDPAESAELEGLQAPWTLEKALRLVELHPNFRDHDEERWRSAIKWAELEGDDDLLFELKRRYRPTAMCGNDTSPARHRAELRNLCLRTGRLACAAEIAGVIDGPALPHPERTFLPRLPEGTAPYTYVAGLILHYPGSTGDEIVRPQRDPYGPNNYGWKESASLLADRLNAIGADANTDPLNRHRLALAVVNVGGHFRSPIEKVAHEREVATRPWVPGATSALMLERATAHEQRIEEYLAQGLSEFGF